MMRFALKLGVALTCTAAVLVSSCTHDDSSVFVHGVMFPTSASGGGGCVYKNDPTQPHLFSGVVDVAFLASYRPVILVGNQLIAQSDTESFRTETNRIAFQGAVVTVEDATGKELHTFTTLASGIADPATGPTPGWGLVNVTLISPELITRIRTGKFPDGTADDPKIVVPSGGSKRLLVRYKIFGQTLGGASVETNESQFPVDVCNGCLVYFPVAADDPAQDGYQCSGGDVGSVKQPCVFGQDEPIDCRLCNNLAICRP